MTKTRLLLADDHSTLRKFLAYMLGQTEGIEVIGEAQDGYEAIEKTRLLRPHAVIMDINMPKMDGIEATQNIRSKFPEVQVIGLSMLDDPITTRRMMDAGALSCFSKDSSWGAIISEIHNVISLSSSANSMPCFGSDQL